MGVHIDGRCHTTINAEIGVISGSVFASSVCANGSVDSLRSMREFRLNVEGTLAALAATANPSGLEPMTARWSKTPAIAKPSDSDGRKYQREYQYDESIDQLNNQIHGKWSHVPGTARYRNRGAS
jgi:hypothetical protein